MRLQLAIRDATTGVILADWSRRAEGCTVSTGAHGYEALRGFVRLSRREALRWFNRQGMCDVALYAGPGVAWEGRLEDVFVAPGGIELLALGAWRAFSDIPYNALWSTTQTGAWRELVENDDPFARASRYEMDTNGRLQIGPKKGDWYNTSPSDVGALVYEAPAGGSRNLVAASFAYEFHMPAGWTARLVTYGLGFASAAVVWSLAATGGLLTGSVNVTFTAAPIVTLQLINTSGAVYDYTLETGDRFLRATELRLKTTTGTVGADTIAQDLVSAVRAVNPSQLSSVTGLIQAPGLDLYDEAYEDQYPIDILAKLAGLGDNQTPPRRWEVGVYEGKALHLRPRGSAGRTWYFDAESPEIGRSLDALWNSAYAVYQNSANRTAREALAPTTDAESVARYGITRRAAVNVKTTSATQAWAQRDAYLGDHKRLGTRAGATIRRITDAQGVSWPLWHVRAGDTLVDRAAAIELSSDSERLTRFVVAATEYDVDADTLQATPEAPTKTVDVLLARQEEGI